MISAPSMSARRSGARSPVLSPTRSLFHGPGWLSRPAGTEARPAGGHAARPGLRAFATSSGPRRRRRRGRLRAGIALAAARAGGLTWLPRQVRAWRLPGRVSRVPGRRPGGCGPSDRRTRRCRTSRSRGGRGRRRRRCSASGRSVIYLDALEAFLRGPGAGVAVPFLAFDGFPKHPGESEFVFLGPFAQLVGQVDGDVHGFSTGIGVQYQWALSATGVVVKIPVYSVPGCRRPGLPDRAATWAAENGRSEPDGRLHHYAEGRVAAAWAARSGRCWADRDRRVHWSHGPVAGGKSADRMTGSLQRRCAARRVAGHRRTRKEAGHAAVPWLARQGTGSVLYRGGEADRGCLPQAATRGPGSPSHCAA